MRTLTPGENAEILSERLRFAIQPPCAVGVLIVDESGRALSPDAFLTDDQSTDGVQVRGSHAEIDTTHLPPDASRALCIALKPSPGGGLDCRLESDGETASTLVSPEHVLPALICFEIYRRSARWKMRAVGQGFSGGRAELLAAYGLATPPADGPKAFTPEVKSLQCGPTATRFAPLGADDPLERLSMIFEDAARITAAFTSARDFADSRRDDELSNAVADPHTRNMPATHSAATAAQKRYADLMTRARSDYQRDAAHLRAEIDTLDPELPASIASWTSPSWRRPATPSPGIRLGTVSRPDAGPLAVPLTTTAPLRRPVWIDTEYSPAGAPPAASLIVRLLAAGPRAASLDIIDLEGTLQHLCRPLTMWMPRPAATTNGGAAARLRDLAHAADLASMAQSVSQPQSPRIVVVTEFPFGLSREMLGDIAILISRAPSAGISLIFIGDPNGESAALPPLLRDISDRCLHLSTNNEATVIDPWTRGSWQFTPSTLGTVARLAEMVQALTGTAR